MSTIGFITSNPLVSVLTPTRNRSGYVALAVEMFCAQTYSPREMVIVEDGEDDLRSWLISHFGVMKTGAAMLKRLIRRDDVTSILVSEDVAIHYVRHEGTTGAKLNKAAQVSSGEYLLRFDDDDWQHPERIEMQMEHFRISGKAMVGLTSMIFYQEGMPHGWTWSGISNDPLGASQAFRRDWLLSHPVPDQTLSEDTACAKVAWEQDQLFTVSGAHTLIVARDHASNTGKRSDDEFRDSPFCESFLKVDLGDWYSETVKPWVDMPLERTPIERKPKKDWAAFAAKVNAQAGARVI